MAARFKFGISRVNPILGSIHWVLPVEIPEGVLFAGSWILAESNFVCFWEWRFCSNFCRSIEGINLIKGMFLSNFRLLFFSFDKGEWHQYIQTHRYTSKYWNIPYRLTWIWKKIGGRKFEFLEKYSVNTKYF